ncbi:YceI family protein [Flavobacterium sp.]|uniref:YceI family protein n=1 Tax=Flavobacterium sp. TaxID=239 RepID=UPI00286E5922|nr:YceI family protein [Flavobacterium sp.]
MILLISIIVSTPSILKAQSCPIIPLIASINVHGTSNVHDWDMKATNITGELGLNGYKQINAILIKIEVKSLKSGNGIMDGKTYDAFDFKKNPYIVFQLTEISQSKLSDNDSEITLTGNLSFAGAIRKISIKTVGKITKSGDYQLKGSVPLKMTDFKMKPPTAMLGTMKTGDAVTIKFDVTFKG